MKAHLLDPTTQKNVDRWLQGEYDAATKAEIQQMLESNPQQIVDAFYTHLSFGTGGLRGIMGVGTNRMNNYTVRACTQGVANYLLKLSPHAVPSVFIGFDSRHHSEEFAEETAKVLAGNGLRVFLYQKLRPSPLISFGCRYKKCSAGIMITASHNPKEYNGYKVYWNDGAQILPPHDKNIMAEVEKVKDPSQVKRVKSIEDPLIERVEEEVDEAYLKAIFPVQIDPEQNRKEGSKLKIAYTSLHGTGITLVPKALERAGFTNVVLVEQQVTPDGNFPTAKSPNPEEKEALELGIETFEKIAADLLIVTDPDTDRIGIVVRHEEKSSILNGNQIACLALEYILETLFAQNRLPEKAAFIKTISTTELFKAICESFHKPCIDVLTGFKYVGEKIREWELEPQGLHYIFGAEESHGYLIGTQTRDKDAVTASILMAEVALAAKKKSLSLVDKLHALYQKHGFYLEKLYSILFEETKEGKEKMAKSIQRVQHSPPTSIAGVAVSSIEDYNNSIKIDLLSGKKAPLTLPKSNVLLFWLEDGSKLMIRPSGTEPKIKIYCGIVQKSFSSIEEAEAVSTRQATALFNDFQTIFS